MENILDRLSKYMKKNGLNNNEITVAAGLSNGLIGNAFTKGKGLNTDTIEKILYAYPDLNVEWLFTGRGKMVRNPSKIDENCVDCLEKDKKITTLQDKLIITQEKIIELQSEISEIKKSSGILPAKSADIAAAG